jgi:hypothetical protein
MAPKLSKKRKKQKGKAPHRKVTPGKKALVGRLDFLLFITTYSNTNNPSKNKESISQL